MFKHMFSNKDVCIFLLFILVIYLCKVSLISCTYASSKLFFFENNFEGLIITSNRSAIKANESKPLAFFPIFLNSDIKINFQRINKSLYTNPEYSFFKIINQASIKYGLPANLIASVIKCESAFDPLARSSTGACGLMQLMRKTADMLGVKNIFDARENIFGGTRYLKQLFKEFQGDINMSLAAYNAGPGSVKKYGGIPPFNQTKKYIKKVLFYKNFYDKFGPFDIVKRENLEKCANYFDDKDYINALKFSLNTLKHNNNAPGLLHNTALIYDLKGAYGIAEKYYLKALIVDPYFFESAWNLAALYIKRNKYKNALKYLESYVQSCPVSTTRDKACAYMENIKQFMHSNRIK